MGDLFKGTGKTRALTQLFVECRGPSLRKAERTCASTFLTRQAKHVPHTPRGLILDLERDCRTETQDAGVVYGLVYKMNTNGTWALCVIL